MSFLLKRLSKMVALMIALASSNANAMSCVIENIPQFIFGHYDPKSPVALDVQASFAIQCTPAFRGEILNLQISFAGIGAGQLKMRNASTGDMLNFGMYKDAARVQPIDAQSVLTFNTPLLTTTTMSLPIFGRVPARQNVAVGNYQLPVTVIVNF